MTEISSAKQSFLTAQLMPAAIAFFQDTLKVFPVSGALQAAYFCTSAWQIEQKQCAAAPANPQKCGSYVAIPEGHLGSTDQHADTKYCVTQPDQDCTNYVAGPGVSNADFVIYVTAQTVGSCPSEAGSGTLAFASSCRADQYDRPTFGYVNFW